MDVDKNDRPLEPVLIAGCGELEKRQKGERKSVAQPAESAIKDGRGRRRKSDDVSDEEMEGNTVAPTPTATRARRQSDNAVDEGLRGRPRQRSGSRSISRPLSTPIEQDENEDPHSQSPAPKHKRKRSPSPSRHLKAKAPDGAVDELEARRRRSLPNQYGDEHYRRNRGDEERYRPSPRRDSKYTGGGHDDRYRPARDNAGGYRGGGGGSRLGGGGGHEDSHDPTVKFKGRGAMKYREPGRL